MEYGLNNDNDSVDDDISLSNEDFSNYGEEDEHIDETDSEEGDGTRGEACDLGGIQTPIEGASYLDEFGPSSMDVRDLIPFFSIKNGDGTIHYESELDATMSNQHSGKEWLKA